VADGNLRNQFLLAMPGMMGSYFGDTITYLCEHSEEGAMGLMINRRTQMSLYELISHAGQKAGNSMINIPVYEGGPVSPQQGFVLHTASSIEDDHGFATSMDLGNGLMLSTAVDLLERLGTPEGPEKFLVALGYAGWGPGQLEGELAENAWLTVPASAEIVFETEDNDKVTRAAATLGINFSLISGQAGHA
jgi:putative transcriptional regulator